MFTYNVNEKGDNMKKKFFFYLLAMAICVTLVGCGKTEDTNDDLTLNDIYYKVGVYFADNSMDRSNLGANSLDTKNNVVIVELIDNSTEKQESFLKNAKIDSKYSKYIKFQQGGPYSGSVE
jgi:hypothetical protein